MIYDCMIYVNKRTKILPPVTSQITYATGLIIFAQPIFMPRFKSINLIKIALILSYFCKKTQNFQAFGVLSSDPQAPEGL